MEDRNHKKYLRYKKKYLKLKSQLAYRNQHGGADNINAQLGDEIHFWGRQLMEHLLLLYLGLQDDNNDIIMDVNITELFGQKYDVSTSSPSLKNKAFEIFQLWKQYLQNIFYDRGVNVTMETIYLDKNDLEKVGSDFQKNRVDELLQKTIEFKKLVISILGQGKWIGWIYPSLANHMLHEAQYFNRKLNGPAFTIFEEIQFCNTHHSTEMAVTAQLIDPEQSQQKIIDIVRSYALNRMSDNESAETFPKEWTKEQEEILQGLRPSEETNMLIISIKYGDELTQLAKNSGEKIEKNELKSTISPVLAHHVHREFVRLTDTLKRLQEKENKYSRDYD